MIIAPYCFYVQRCRTSYLNPRPKTRGVKDISERMSALARYESWQEPTKMDFESIVGTETWNKHWDNWAKVQQLMKESQALAIEINHKVAEAYKAS
ncbi:hypothetical protein D8T55_23090 [Vibrio vulnificus]|uniref:hypothetical protein n=1 Tax=Vibrio vulnificus TaxID=672 RepID=UPI0010E7EC3D|nr:hypothetical protein [Vibrio vulnificus]EIO3971419.1 hypothetical protein [Vibrio vulnificus]RZQ36692.1 hypothetical protein D8T55_23090 [Vibrio vulnificus]